MCYNKFPLWPSGMGDSIETTSLISTTATVPEEDENGCILEYILGLLIIVI